MGFAGGQKYEKNGNCEVCPAGLALFAQNFCRE